LDIANVAVFVAVMISANFEQGICQVSAKYSYGLQQNDIL
jgi:hypothetical protein